MNIPLKYDNCLSWLQPASYCYYTEKVYCCFDFLAFRQTEFSFEGGTSPHSSVKCLFKWLNVFEHYIDLPNFMLLHLISINFFEPT
jgi:hypothetical protein